MGSFEPHGDSRNPLSEGGYPSTPAGDTVGDKNEGAIPHMPSAVGEDQGFGSSTVAMGPRRSRTPIRAPRIICDSCEPRYQSSRRLRTCIGTRGSRRGSGTHTHTLEQTRDVRSLRMMLLRRALPSVSWDASTTRMSSSGLSRAGRGVPDDFGFGISFNFD